MKAITIRNVEPSVSEKLKCEAKNQGKSVNQFIIDMIEQNLGFKKKKKFSNIHHDLDHLFGKWTDEEYNQIQGRIDKERKIDKELWE
ncbi:MAG: toxin-antitoxin system HicB family antitoxin [bacterium]